MSRFQKVGEGHLHYSHKWGLTTPPGYSRGCFIGGTPVTLFGYSERFPGWKATTSKPASILARNFLSRGYTVWRRTFWQIGPACAIIHPYETLAIPGGL